MKVIFVTLLLFLNASGWCQLNNTAGYNKYPEKGIQWMAGLSWSEIKAKAKIDNKPIFIDVYATWCSPCRLMETEVFSTEDVAKLINENFIPVRIQMDRTNKDAPDIKDWYADAEVIKRQYGINAYPSFLFLSPQGVLTNRATGYKSAGSFIGLTRVAIKPGQVYKNPYERYEKLIAEFYSGKLRYKEMPYMINVATKLREYSVRDSLIWIYYDFLAAKPKKFYTKGNISLVANNLASKSRFFNKFYPDGSEINAVMENSEYSRCAIDNVIELEIINPFLYAFYKKYPLNDIKEKSLEPYWNALQDSVQSNYNSKYAERAVRKAKYTFSFNTRNDQKLIESFIEQLKFHDLDTTDKMANFSFNTAAWKAFLSSDDKELIEQAVDWVRGAIRRMTPVINSPAYLYDTYANLVYKGNLLFSLWTKEEAIQLEEYAARDAREKGRPYEDYLKTIEKMKAGQRTW